MLHRTTFLFASTILLLAAPAGAQTQGFAIDRFEPSERGSEWFTADTLDLRGGARPAFGVVADYGHNPYSRNGEVVVNHQLFAHVGGSLVFLDRFRFGVSLPIAISQGGETVRTMSGPTKGGVGDLRLGLDARLLGRYGDAFTLALGVGAWLPTGDRDQLLGDGSVRVGPRLSIAGDAGLSYAATIGMVYRKNEDGYGTRPSGSELPFAVAIGKRFADGKLLIGPELSGRTLLKEAFTRNTTTLELLVGGHYSAGDFRIGLGAGPGLTKSGIGSPDLRVVGSLEWAPAYSEEPKKPADRDGDGVADLDDACPDQAGDPALKGCPDTDKDGIADRDDACKTEVGPKTEDPKTNGCPVPADSDGDGVVDKDDACPNLAGVKTDDPKTSGCPTDKDGDAVYDKDDACPEIAGVKTEDPKTNGCPGDKDKDGVRDDLDACPDQAGLANADPKKNGCPAVFIAQGQVKISDQIKFKTGSAEILKESQPIIDAVAKVLKDHPELKLVRVEGHTDNVGSPAKNKDLSKRRAAAVVAALAKAGVEKSRLASDGFGQEKPLESNDSEAGRANNRRVEFHISEPKK